MRREPQTSDGIHEPNLDWDLLISVSCSKNGSFIFIWDKLNLLPFRIEPSFAQTIKNYFLKIWRRIGHSDEKSQ